MYAFYYEKTFYSIYESCFSITVEPIRPCSTLRCFRTSEEARLTQSDYVTRYSMQKLGTLSDNHLNILENADIINVEKEPYVTFIQSEQITCEVD